VACPLQPHHLHVRDARRATMDTTVLREMPPGRVIRHELQAIRGKWPWLVALAIALIVLGTIMLGFPVASTLATGGPGVSHDRFGSAAD
jgi:hypothetical protein